MRLPRITCKETIHAVLEGAVELSHHEVGLGPSAIGISFFFRSSKKGVNNFKTETGSNMEGINVLTDLCLFSS
jgi:hypothetical protein